MGVIEEFFPGQNVVEADGRLVASVVGILKADLVKRILWIEPLSRVHLPSPGSMVYAYILSLREDLAHARVLGTDLRRLFKHPLPGMIHISQARQDPGEKSMAEILRTGDLVYAKNLSKGSPYILSLRAPRAGVVLSLCPRCASYLKLKGGRLSCPRCGYEESRKISQLYINI